MVPRNRSAMSRALAAALISLLLFQGVQGEFTFCYCSCYSKCKRSWPAPKYDLRCHNMCFNSKKCSFTCHYPVAHTDVGVAIASGGGSLGMVNGTEAAGAVAAGGGGSLRMGNGTGDGAAP